MKPSAVLAANVELAFVEPYSFDLRLYVARELLVGRSAEIVTRLNSFRIPLVPPQYTERLSRRSAKHMAEIRECCLPGMLAGLLVLPKGNRKDFESAMRAMLRYCQSTARELKKKWRSLTRRARDRLLDLIQVRYHRIAPGDRVPDELPRISKRALDEFDKRVKAGLTFTKPSWTYVRVAETMTTEPRIVGYTSLTNRLSNFLAHSHEQAVDILIQQLGRLAALDPAEYPDRRACRLNFIRRYSAIKIERWWNWFDTLRDDHGKKAVSALGPSWEKLHRALARHSRFTIVKRLALDVRGSCAEAVKRLEAHPAVGEPPVLSGAVSAEG